MKNLFSVIQGSHSQTLKFFNDISRQKSQISMIIPNVTKRKKHRTTCCTWSPHTSYNHSWVFFRKSVQSSYLIWWIIIIISIFRLGCCLCPIQLGLAAPGYAEHWLSHSDHVFRGLPFPLGPGSRRSVTDLIQDVACCCTCPYHLSRPLRRTAAVISLMPSFWSSETEDVSRSRGLWCHKSSGSWCGIGPRHYSDVIMSAMAFQITSLTSVYSTV